MANKKVKTTTGRQTEPRQINLAKSACRFRKLLFSLPTPNIVQMDKLVSKEKFIMNYFANIDFMTGGSLTFMGYTLLQILLGF